jgi:hypothetical protein
MQMFPETVSHTQLMPIDTLAIAKRLQASGMPAKQAETQAEVFGEIVTQNLASKSDIENLRKDAHTAIESLRKETTTAIESLRKETTTAIESLRKDTTTAIESLRKDTTTGIESLRKETFTAIEDLRKDLTIKIAEAKNHLLMWIIPIIVGQVAILFSVLRVVH